MKSNQQALVEIGMAFGRCKLTKKEGTFARAHIIPKAFCFRPGSTKRVASTASDRPSRAPVGLYDSNLVILDTERRILAPLDDYGVRFLRGEVGRWHPITERGEVVAFAVSEFDNDAVALFFLSILWRASASVRYEVVGCNLGPSEEILRRILIKELAWDDCYLGILLLKFSDAYAEVPITTPYRHPRDGIEFYQASFGGSRVMWKTDDKSLLSPLAEMQLPKSGRWLVSANSWWLSDDRLEAQRIVRENVTKYGAFWEN